MYRIKNKKAITPSAPKLIRLAGSPGYGDVLDKGECSQKACARQ